MYEVLLGESRITITENLRSQLGWRAGDKVGWIESEPGVYMVTTDVESYRRIIMELALAEWDGDAEWAESVLLRKGLGWFFTLRIPGVSRGRLRHSRTCKFSIEGDTTPKTLVLDTRE